MSLSITLVPVSLNPRENPTRGTNTPETCNYTTPGGEWSPEKLFAPTKGFSDRTRRSIEEDRALSVPAVRRKDITNSPNGSGSNHSAARFVVSGADDLHPPQH